MRVLVSDTSVLIDLERCELLQSAFALDAELVVPDVLFDRELKDHNGTDLLTMGLRVESVDPDGVAQAQAYLKRQRRLSVPDALALFLARRNGWVLLSGDGALRTLAGEEQVECHGILWLLDQIEQQAAGTVAQLNEGLRRLSVHPRCRLPGDEVTVRLERYAALLGGN